ncbi:MAG TPA: hypothetical protein VK856_05440 [Anaerolineaceae bacterium]|nr:hypothetical protein [Anaerolineaceae bacterium]
MGDFLNRKVPGRKENGEQNKQAMTHDAGLYSMALPGHMTSTQLALGICLILHFSRLMVLE